MVIRISARSWDVTICVLVAQDSAFKKCCMKTGHFDGSGRNYFFPRIDSVHIAEAILLLKCVPQVST